MSLLHYLTLALIMLVCTGVAFVLGVKHGCKIANDAFDKAVKGVKDALNDGK